MIALQLAADYYDIIPDEAKLLKGYTNQIYDCGDKILQFTSKHYKSSEELELELNFINYLRSNGSGVVEIIPSKDGNLFEELEKDFIICYKKIQGSKISRATWNEQHFSRLGKLTGRLHHLGKNFAKASKANFKHWYEIPKAQVNMDLPKDEQKLVELHEHLLQIFQSYAIHEDNYGIIHYDIHHDNYLLKPSGSIILFDFEMTCQSWYVHEIGNVLYYALLVPEMEGREQWFLNHFLKGYSKENTLTKGELEKIPNYLLYRALLVYAYICKIWTGDNLTPKNKAYKERLEYSILWRKNVLGL